MKWFLVLLAIVAVHSKATKKAPKVEENVYDIEKEWKNYLDTYELDYETDPAETARRKQIFKTNYELINAHNRGYNAQPPTKTFLMKPTLEEDLDDAEWLQEHTRDPPCSLPAVTPSTARTRRAATPFVVPEAVDWTKGDIQVTSVKSQGQCGSCYIFAAVGILEGYHKRAKQRLVDISEKYFLDCGSHETGDFGCTGGNPTKVLNYAKNTGYSTTDNYIGIYNAKKGKCRHPKTPVKIPKFETVSPITEVKLKEVLAKYGPVSILLNTKTRSFKRYKSGVYSDPNCAPTVTHAVLLVGYGNDNRLGKYWLIKNSHGADFGESGYFRLGRDQNLCGITKQANYIPYPEK